VPSSSNKNAEKRLMYNNAVDEKTKSDGVVKPLDKQDNFESQKYNAEC